MDAPREMQYRSRQKMEIYRGNLDSAGQVQSPMAECQIEQNRVMQHSVLGPILNTQAMKFGLKIENFIMHTYICSVGTSYKADVIATIFNFEAFKLFLKLQLEQKNVAWIPVDFARSILEGTRISFQIEFNFTSSTAICFHVTKIQIKETNSQVMRALSCGTSFIKITHCFNGNTWRGHVFKAPVVRQAFWSNQGWSLKWKRRYLVYENSIFKWAFTMEHADANKFKDGFPLQRGMTVSSVGEAAFRIGRDNPPKLLLFLQPINNSKIDEFDELIRIVRTDLESMVTTP